MAEEMPAKAGVYKMIGDEDKILYIGKAKNLPKRVISYSKINALTNRLRRMVSQIIRIEYITTSNESEALLLEAHLIKSIRPIFNIALKDDKSFPYIMFENVHDYPRISKHRGKLKKENTYFGPFASAGDVNQTLTELQKIFQLRPCTDSYFDAREKPCLQYQIKRCSAPCVKKISVKDYKVGVQDAKNFLAGKSTYIQEKLIAEMEEASKKYEYEHAGLIRDKIKVLNQIQAKNSFINTGVSDADLIVGVTNKAGKFCVQVFFIRAGKNYGHKSYHFSKDWDIELEEVMQTFIGQFYQYHQPPKKIILNRKIHDLPVLKTALETLSKNKIEFVIPSRGNIKDLIDFAVENTKEELSKKERERIKNENNLAAVAGIFSIKKDIKRIEVYDNSH
ncbi:UNVERIFIED_CONTAM: hypothetical protein GTU68_032114, partial [Idotea baltica]|nr:hypothetical protein [Idotea baltica]